MAQTALLLKSLKQCLKQHHLTYADVAKQLNLSEASIKRIFSEENISLQRLDQICNMMNMEITDLSKVAEQALEEIKELSEEQEAEFVKQPKLLFMAYMLLNDINFDTIIAHYNIDKHEGIQLLAHLDRIKFITLLPDNKVKLLASRQFKWQKNGAIEKLFNGQIKKEFFQSKFSNTNDCIQFGAAMVSRKTLLQMHKKIEKLNAEFNDLAKQDGNLPFNERFGCAVVSAIKPWEFSLFSEFNK